MEAGHAGVWRGGSFAGNSAQDLDEPILRSWLPNFAGFVRPEGENCFENGNFGRRNLRADRRGFTQSLALASEWPSFWFDGMNLTGGG